MYQTKLLLSWTYNQDIPGSCWHEDFMKGIIPDDTCFILQSLVWVLLRNHFLEETTNGINLGLVYLSVCLASFYLLQASCETRPWFLNFNPGAFLTFVKRPPNHAVLTGLSFRWDIAKGYVLTRCSHYSCKNFKKYNMQNHSLLLGLYRNALVLIFLKILQHMREPETISTKYCCHSLLLNNKWISFKKKIRRAETWNRSGLVV